MTSDPQSSLARHATAQIEEALLDTRIIGIIGPRQSGKTTLARMFESDNRPLVSLDNETDRSFALADPVGFIRQFDQAVIDEVQRAPELVLALKMAVDQDGRPGRFIVTGSSDFLKSPRTPDSLAGRIELIRLLPLSQAEILRQPPSSFVDRLFANALDAPAPALSMSTLRELVLAGGYPAALTRSAPKRRRDWFMAYTESLATRDLPELAAIDKIGAMPRLISLSALYAGDVVNLSRFGAELGLDAKTVDRWLTLLENIFLIRRVRPWFRNSFKRLSKTPKLHFLDSGLLAALRNVDAETAARDPAVFGPILECFVHAELAKTIALGHRQTSISHYRDQDQVEVDFVLEGPSRKVAGVEVKGTATIRPADFKGLQRLQEAAGEGFVSGVILYTGDRVVRVSETLCAIPISALWV